MKCLWSGRGSTTNSLRNEKVREMELKWARTHVSVLAIRLSPVLSLEETKSSSSQFANCLTSTLDRNISERGQPG
jgi:hypothetical protein